MCQAGAGAGDAKASNKRGDPEAPVGALGREPWVGWEVFRGHRGSTA